MGHTQKLVVNLELCQFLFHLGNLELLTFNSPFQFPIFIKKCKILLPQGLHLASKNAQFIFHFFFQRHSYQFSNNSA